LEEIPNVAYRSDGGIKFTGLRYVPAELDELRPKYDIVVKVLVRRVLISRFRGARF
jgi:hypothetical protein